MEFSAHTKAFAEAFEQIQGARVAQPAAFAVLAQGPPSEVLREPRRPQNEVFIPDRRTNRGPQEQRSAVPP
jgi:hypothetical protein